MLGETGCQKGGMPLAWECSEAMAMLWAFTLKHSLVPLRSYAFFARSD